MNLSDVLQQGHLTMRKENNRFIIIFTATHEYGTDTTYTFEGDTLKEAYEKLVKSDRLKSI